MEEKYGSERVCSIGTYTTFQIKAAIKDLSRAKGLDIGTTELVCSLIGGETTDGRFFREPWSFIFGAALKNSIIKSFVENNPELIEHIQLCLGQPKASSVHACATLILPENESIFTSIPVRQGEIDGEKLLVSEWEGELIEKAGYLKEDILGITQLDKFRMIMNLVKENYDCDIDIYSIPLHEKEVYKMFQKGYNGDVFHLGSKSLTKYCVELQPDKIDDLIASLAVYRPGPIENNTHNEFILLRHGEKEPDYDKGTEIITKETYSLIIYQEQIMQICQKIGGFSLVEADDIRKAMGKLNQSLLDSYKDRWYEGALKNGYHQELVESLWNKMVSFGGYAFNKCFSGKEKIFRASTNQYKSDFTIEEMYKIRNDYSYAKLTGHLDLRDRYRRSGYGFCLSLDSRNRLVKNKIVDIRYEGIRIVFEVTTESGRKIRTTANHKYPTSNGEKKLSEIDIEKDLLFINSGYEVCKTKYNLTDGTENNFPSQGVQGFQKKDFSPFESLNQFTIKNKNNPCEICGKFHKRMEAHHKDGDRENNQESNFSWLCPGCHKKEHYKLGRVKKNEKGYLTHFEKIISIKVIGNEDVYDVEVSGDVSHTLLLESGIVSSNSHSAVYAITGYICQYLKWKFPLPYWITALEFASDDSTLRFISEINLGGKIKVSPPDINKSQLRFSADFKTNKIIWSISKVKQCGEISVKVIFDERNKNGEFFSLEEFLSRVDKSKVNKSVVENLIFAGAFDELENISYPAERRILINSYRELSKTKVDKKTDWYEVLKQTSAFYEDWVWQLRQKQVSGLAFFDYKSLVQNLQSRDLKQFMFFSEISLQKDDDRKRVFSAGIVLEVELKSSKKGDWMRLRLDQNYEFIWLYVWSDVCEKYKSLLLESKDAIVVFNGRVTYDSFRKENIVQAEEDFLVEVLR